MADPQDNQRSPRQDAGYDEASRGGKGVPPSDVGVPLEPDRVVSRDPDDRAADDAASEVRRRERSAG